MQVPRTCEQGAKRALWTAGMGCIWAYANACRWSNRPEVKGPFVTFTSWLPVSPSLSGLGVLHETRQPSSCHSGPPWMPKASHLLGALRFCTPFLQHHAPRKFKFSRPLSEAGWCSCAAGTLLRAHHEAGGRIHFSASSCSGQQTAPVLWVISKSNGNNIWPFSCDEIKSMPLCQHVHLLSKRERAQIGVSCILSPLWYMNFCVIQSCWRAGTSPCTSTHGRSTRNNAGNAGAFHISPFNFCTGSY